MNTMRRLDITEAAKLLRRELREKFAGVKFSVRIDRFSMGESIDVRWLDGPATLLVDSIVDKYSDIDRDPATGEILSGGNRYANTARKYSPEIQAKVTEEFNAGKYPGYPTEWNVLCMTDFYQGKAPRTYSREEIRALKEKNQPRLDLVMERALNSCNSCDAEVTTPNPRGYCTRCLEETRALDTETILEEARKQVSGLRYIQ